MCNLEMLLKDLLPRLCRLLEDDPPGVVRGSFGMGLSINPTTTAKNRRLSRRSRSDSTEDQTERRKTFGLQGARNS